MGIVEEKFLKMKALLAYSLHAILVLMPSVFRYHHDGFCLQADQHKLGMYGVALFKMAGKSSNRALIVV